MEIIKKYYQTILNDDVNSFVALENKYGLDIFSNENISLPVECATYNAFNICNYIYKKGISIDATVNPFQQNALYKAISLNNFTLAEWLIANGSNPNGNILANGTPIYSILNNINRVLLELTFDPNNPRKKVDLEDEKLQKDLQNNVNYQNNKKLIKLLLDKGADPNIIIPSLCKTVLDVCRTYGHKDIEHLLLNSNAKSAREKVDFSQNINSGILQFLEENFGEILSLDFYSKNINDVRLRLSLIKNDNKLKLIFTEGLYKHEPMCELMFCLDTYIPINQQLIDSNNPYNFFAKILFEISKSITLDNIKLSEGIIFDKRSLLNIEFPKNIDGLMLIDYQFSNKEYSGDSHNNSDNVTLWLLVPFKYPKSGKFTPQTLEKFIRKQKTSKLKNVSYYLEKDNTGEFMPIF